MLSLMAVEKVLIPPGGGVPAFILHKGIIRPQIHGHGCAADWTAGYQFAGDFSILLFGHHLFDNGFVIIGLLVAGPGTLPQAVVALGIEQPLLVKSCLLETMIHIGGQHKIVLSLHQFQKLLINWLRGVQIAIDIDIPAPIRPMFFQAVKGIEAA